MQNCEYYAIACHILILWALAGQKLVPWPYPASSGPSPALFVHGPPGLCRGLVVVLVVFACRCHHINMILICLLQELLAYGICNTFSSMFNSFVSTASLSRSVIQDISGGRTQVISPFSYIVNNVYCSLFVCHSLLLCKNLI